jgi:putative FmdB family regulatory protein
MPLYDYRCDACGHKWEENLTISNRDKPCKSECPHCEKKGEVKKDIAGFPGLNVDTTLTPDKKTGGRGSEIMNKVNNNLPDRYKTGSDLSGHRWKG